MNTHNQDIDIQYAIAAEGIPCEEDLCKWASTALQEKTGDVELVIRIVDEAEITALNHRYRGKDRPTNVLSFPYEPIAGIETGLLGDVIICAPVVVGEAVTQGKPLEAHWAHMVIHGVLHLLGYDHSDDTGAREMERLEADQLASLGYQAPY